METSLERLIRRGYEAFNRRDFEAATDVVDPDIELYEDPAFPEAGVYRGKETVLAYWKQFPDVFEEYEIDVEDVLVHGDRIAAFVHQTGRGKDSGAPIDFRIVHVWTFRNGMAVRLDAFIDRERALAALHEGTGASV